MKMRLELTIMVVMLALFSSAKAQKVAVKTDLINDVCLSPNLGMEVGLAPRWTIDIMGQLSAWTLSHGRRWKHWLLQPEVRYCSVTVLLVIFFGTHVHGGQYNIGDLMVVFIS